MTIVLRMLNYTVNLTPIVLILRGGSLQHSRFNYKYGNCKSNER